MPTQNTTIAQVKKPKNLQLQDPNNPDQPVNLTQPPVITPQQVQPVSGGQTPTSQLAHQTLTQAQQQAQKGYQSPTLSGTSQLTQQLLNDPNRGFNASDYVKSGLTEYDRNTADAIETARRGLVGASGSSLAQSGLTDLALRTAEGRASLGNELRTTASDQERQNILNAIQAGQATTGLEQGVQRGNLQGLIDVIEAAQPQLDREENAINRGLEIAIANQNAQLQTYLTELQGKISKGLQTNAQDWQGIQNELDREIEKWSSEGNWDNALKAITLKGQIDQQAQESAQKWQTGERVATQSWTTTERLSAEDFTSAENFLDRTLQEAIANQDDATQRWVTEKQAELSLKMQTNDMAQERRMAYLNSELENAKADNDVGRQKTLLNFQQALRIKEMTVEYGYDKAIETMRGDIQKEIAAGNNLNAEAMQKAELEYRVNKDIEDRKIEWAANALQEKGLNMQLYQQQLDQIDDMIENYGIDPSFKTEFVKATLKGQGVDTTQFTQTDVTAEAQKALSAEFDMIKYQFAQSHAGMVDPNTGELTSDGLQAFNDYYNYTMYGELSPEMKEERRVAGYLGPDDLAFAEEGDKFNITEATDYNGITIPPGEYNVVKTEESYGSKFFGTQQSTYRVKLVDANGNEYQIDKSQSGKKGNIVSNLWAQ